MAKCHGHRPAGTLAVPSRSHRDKIYRDGRCWGGWKRVRGRRAHPFASPPTVHIWCPERWCCDATVNWKKNACVSGMKYMDLIYDCSFHFDRKPIFCGRSTRSEDPRSMHHMQHAECCRSRTSGAAVVHNHYSVRAVPRASWRAQHIGIGPPAKREGRGIRFSACTREAVLIQQIIQSSRNSHRSSETMAYRRQYALLYGDVRVKLGARGDGTS